MILEAAEPDPLTTARVAIRLVCCATADEAVLFDVPRVRLGPGGAVMDDVEAASALHRLTRPLRISAERAGREVIVRAEPVGGAFEPPYTIPPASDVSDPDARTVLAWIAGTGFPLSWRELERVNNDFLLGPAGFIAAYSRPQLGAEMADTLGVAAHELARYEWLVLAGRPRPPGDPPGGMAPIRRYVCEPE